MSDQEQRPGKGCFFYGCVTFLVLLLAAGFGTYFGTRKAVRVAVETYLHNEPMPLSTIRLTRAGQEQAVEKFETAFEAARRGLPVPRLELSEQELNVALRKSGLLGRLQEQTYIRVETNQLKADISIPLDQFEIWRSLGKKLFLSTLQGRYLNGTAHLQLTVVDGKLDLRVSDIMVNGNALPSTFMANLRTENLANSSTPGQKEGYLEWVERVEIEGEKIIIYLRQPAKEQII